MRASILMALLALAALLSGPRALAIDSIPPLPDPALQQRYLTLTHELRCMQCQNESIADSPVGLASDLRREVRNMLLAGKSEEEVFGADEPSKPELPAPPSTAGRTASTHGQAACSPLTAVNTIVRATV